MPASLAPAAGIRRKVLRISGIIAVGVLTMNPSTTFPGTVAEASSSATTVSEEKPFAGTSPFNVPIPEQPALDPNSAAMVAQASRSARVYANLYEFGIPVHSAPVGTPRHDVSCTAPWGTCPFQDRSVAIPSHAAPNSGSDGAMVVMDATTNTVSEFWQARRSADGRWTTTWGAINSLSGSGWGGNSTGSGASRLGGVIRVDEIGSGVIDHALVVQSDNVCQGVHRAPALKTDGTSTRSDCLPEGARLQLDPGLDVTAISGITPGEVAVARAMQVYGAYVVDQGGAALSMSFELAPDATPTSPGAVYEAAGLRWDYYGMSKVPWNRLRVLATWQGDPVPATSTPEPTPITSTTAPALPTKAPRGKR
ncbi:hypothetical protein MRU69_13780 [Kocuria flava]|nr:hypothetical protein [Kocuria flava]